MPQKTYGTYAIGNAKTISSIDRTSTAQVVDAYAGAAIPEQPNQAAFIFTSGVQTANEVVIETSNFDSTGVIPKFAPLDDSGVPLKYRFEEDITQTQTIKSTSTATPFLSANAATIAASDGNLYAAVFTSTDGVTAGFTFARLKLGLSEYQAEILIDEAQTLDTPLGFLHSISIVESESGVFYVAIGSYILIVHTPSYNTYSLVYFAPPPNNRFTISLNKYGGVRAEEGIGVVNADGSISIAENMWPYISTAAYRNNNGELCAIQVPAEYTSGPYVAYSHNYTTLERQNFFEEINTDPGTYHRVLFNGGSLFKSHVFFVTLSNTQINFVAVSEWTNSRHLNYRTTDFSVTNYLPQNGIKPECTESPDYSGLGTTIGLNITPYGTGTHSFTWEFEQDRFVRPSISTTFWLTQPYDDTTRYGLEMIPTSGTTGYYVRVTVEGNGSTGYLLRYGSISSTTTVAISAVQNDTIRISMLRQSQTGVTNLEYSVNGGDFVNLGDVTATTRGSLTSGQMYVIIGAWNSNTGTGHSVYLRGFRVYDGVYLLAYNGVTLTQHTQLTGGIAATYGGGLISLGDKWYVRQGGPYSLNNLAIPTQPRGIKTGAGTGDLVLNLENAVNLDSAYLFLRGWNKVFIRIDSQNFITVPSALASRTCVSDDAGRFARITNLPAGIKFGELSGGYLVKADGTSIEIKTNQGNGWLELMEDLGESGTITVHIIPREILVWLEGVTLGAQTTIHLYSNSIAKKMAFIEPTLLAPAWANGWSRRNEAMEVSASWSNGRMVRKSRGAARRELSIAWEDPLVSDGDYLGATGAGLFGNVGETLGALIKDASEREVPSVVFFGEADSSGILWGAEKLFFGVLPAEVTQNHILGEDEEAVYRVQTISIKECV